MNAKAATIFFVTIQNYCLLNQFLQVTQHVATLFYDLTRDSIANNFVTDAKMPTYFMQNCYSRVQKRIEKLVCM